MSAERSTNVPLSIAPLAQAYTRSENKMIGIKMVILKEFSLDLEHILNQWEEKNEEN